LGVQENLKHKSIKKLSYVRTVGMIHVNVFLSIFKCIIYLWGPMSWYDHIGKKRKPI